MRARDCSDRQPRELAAASSSRSPTCYLPPATYVIDSRNDFVDAGWECRLCDDCVCSADLLLHMVDEAGVM
jgi:hypothetical protein